MSRTSEEISAKIKSYILDEYLPQAGEELDEESPLVSSGIIDSISILQVVEFLESTFDFEFEPHEVDQDNLETVKAMTSFVQHKLE
jgi:D-alanine--poly(phosphoribitol) ligase subunit 2